MSLKSSFIQHLVKNYPDFSEAQLDGLVADQMISPFQIHLSQNLLTEIKQEIKAYWNLRSWGESKLSAQFHAKDLRRPSNFSACMSYDFHVNSSNHLELIEINTNAAFLALGLELYQFHQLRNVLPFQEPELIQMFIEEMQLTGQTAPYSLGILDENPTEQRLFLEFLVYQKMFTRNQIQCEILDLKNVSAEHSFLYNRYTDFYLSSEASQPIRKLYNSGQLNLSPNPYDYFLLADKQRMIDWNLQTDVPKPASLLPVYDLATENRDEIWAMRKQLFFKPKNSFGSKQAYKGASISRTAFDNSFQDNFIAQQVSNASEITVTFENQPAKFKYDLRCYAYKDQLQMIIARIYQGQTTNLRTPGGGFACIIID
ncbi:MAG: hypothetical protein A2622_06610 [Bdellovibrionales bacterium RIFCSPHIGHO2_01_FULL_40_29]|nr:MAG: hypothetical protein A2622_06610 [Bdellovibrionales bacterium RIFCSPHIGHO2_01_FULL_40_29]OFZ35113.1 MAG: hypothetical protein A3D17_06960 [Bdellovibrionales bacterium RIFCSPHIGHO2_02_FULL_40_15]